ncbi:MAG: glycoside hydrolase family 43 protein [Ferruginibacter sp.]
MRNNYSTCCLLIFFSFAYYANAQHAATFTNPLLPAGADPWCIYKNGFYYYTHTTGKNITIWKTKTIAGLDTAEKKVVFTPPKTGPYSKEIWAPEIHFLNSKWYIYFAADSGNNISHRIWVLENDSRDPLKGDWKMKGKLLTPDDKWSIDGSIFEHKKQLYFIWSGWEGDVNGYQNIYIAKMKNPWTLGDIRAKISSPELEWEIHGDLQNANDVPHVSVNEGPEVLTNKDKVFLIYSASGCWTDYYALGMLSASDTSNLMDPTSWKKHPHPVFSQSKENNVFAPGHNSFFKSPDGKEDWILYHANDEPGQGCGRHRSPRAQRFIWTKDGLPDFGVPVPTKISINTPSETSN